MVDQLDKLGVDRAIYTERSDAFHFRNQDQKNGAEQDGLAPVGRVLEDTITISPEALAAIENDPLFGLSYEDTQKLDKLFRQIDDIFATAGDQPLSAEQKKQLAALDRKIESILGEGGGGDLFSLLSDEAVEKIDALLTQFDDILLAAGDKPLTADQETQLDDLDRQIQQVIESELGPADPYAGLPPREIKKLDQLFSEIDALFSQTSGAALTPQQTDMLRALEQHVAAIYAQAAQSDEA